MIKPKRRAKLTAQILLAEAGRFRRETLPARCGGLLLMWVEKNEAVYVRKEKS